MTKKKKIPIRLWDQKKKDKLKKYFRMFCMDDMTKCNIEWCKIITVKMILSVKNIFLGAIDPKLNRLTHKK